MGHFIIGTAGHIDHGKTALVKALTGIDTDRLKEEKERGITIDMGFAYWKEGITIIDVPGHERFIRNMVAGVSAIDFVLLVIAADDGIMPQTIEHLEILKLLQIPAGAVAISKSDLASTSVLNELELEIRNFLSGSPLKESPIFTVSASKNTGIEALSQYLQDTAKRSLTRKDKGLFRMNIDRAFSIKGFGTVATGTVLSGTARNGQTVELLPAEKKIRIRGLQKHSHSVEEVTIGDRAAVNVTGIESGVIKRGNVLTEPERLVPTSCFFAKVHILKSIRTLIDRSIRVRLHIGTAEIFGKIQIIENPISAGDSGYVKITTETPSVCIHKDRFVFREINSSATLGGGVVLDHFKTESKPSLSYLHDLDCTNLFSAVHSFIAHHKCITMADIVSVFGLSASTIQDALTEFVKQKQVIVLGGQSGAVVDAIHFATLKNTLIKTIETIHQAHPMEKGLKKSELRMKFAPDLPEDVFNGILKELIKNDSLKEENEILYLSSHRIRLNEVDRVSIEVIERQLLQHLFSPPSLEVIALEARLDLPDIRRLLRTMEQLGKIVKTGENVYFHVNAVHEARQFVIDFITKKDHIKITDFKDQFHTSRKFALSLLEYFDSIHVTSRNGDSRELFYP